MPKYLDMGPAILTCCSNASNQKPKPKVEEEKEAEDDGDKDV